MIKIYIRKMLEITPDKAKELFVKTKVDGGKE